MQWALFSLTEQQKETEKVRDRNAKASVAK
jgi:hypothetical protein